MTDNEIARDEPQVMKKDCGCVLNIWPDTIRTDFCDFHARESVVNAGKYWKVRKHTKTNDKP